MKSITMSVWEAAEKLGVDEQALSSLKDCIPHIVLANECLFPRCYIEACVVFLADCKSSAQRGSLLVFRDMGETMNLIRATQRDLEAALLSDPTKGPEALELSPKAVANIFGVGVPTVDRWGAQGHFPKGKIPKSTLNSSYIWALSS
jgi:hypothetical protein